MLKIIEQTYDEYLKRLSAKNEKERYKGKINTATNKKWFQASGAGQCIKKHYYKMLEFEEIPIDMQTQRLFRIGDLIHTDIQTALKIKFGNQVIIETETTIPELNVRGFADVAFTENEILVVTDIKTVVSYKWSKMFGREANRDKNPSVMYELQNATYVYALCKKYNIDPYSAEGIIAYLQTGPLKKNNLLYYKKDNSAMKFVSVDNHYIDKALDYWENVYSYINEVTKDNIEEIFVPNDPDVPGARWECSEKYCRFYSHCFK